MINLRHVHQALPPLSTQHRLWFPSQLCHWCQISREHVDRFGPEIYTRHTTDYLFSGQCPLTSLHLINSDTPLTRKTHSENGPPRQRTQETPKGRDHWVLGSELQSTWCLAFPPKILSPHVWHIDPLLHNLRVDQEEWCKSLLEPSPSRCQLNTPIRWYIFNQIFAEMSTVT